MKNDFEIIPYTADVGLRARGTNPAQAYANAARGLFSLITDLEKVRESIFRDVSVSSPDKETLLVAWLNELIFFFDTEMLLFKRFEIGNWCENSLQARCYGEKIDRSRHELKRAIKSATYHKLKVEKLADNEYQVQVLLDV
jgi:SHS2 domain-containing protein